MFERNIIKELEQWAVRNNRKPLILRGSRQVGKTSLVDEFGKKFEIYIKINLENAEYIKLFDDYVNMETLLTGIFLTKEISRRNVPTLIFIDEIQYSSRAVMLLRYFYEDYPDIHVIAAGSLLESMLCKNISFPVGRVEYLAVRPCNFCEFLGAMGRTELEKVVREFSVPQGLAIHSIIMDLFNTFSLIGGMPEIVANYADNKDIVGLNRIYESLLTSYRDDVEKYAEKNTMSQVIRYILKNGWKYAAQRVTLGGFAESLYKAREMGEAFRTLEKTFVLELCYPTTDCCVPVTQDLKRSPKLLWLDCGLVNYAAKLQKEVFGTKDILDAYRGKIAEQIVAQELLALDSRVSNVRNFWVREKNTSQAEIDFVLQFDGKVIPVEVKSGHNAHLKSLHLFMNETPHDIAVRVWSQPFSVDKVKTQAGKEFNLINLPFYYLGILEKILEQYI
ncbi:MAG: AAA family ATPase [Tannerella sp.]|jgi:predicted AAA+ superfamily ATPase|nr:AAA family ATPase [Tannerella sp.]